MAQSDCRGMNDIVTRIAEQTNQSCDRFFQPGSTTPPKLPQNIRAQNPLDFTLTARQGDRDMKLLVPGAKLNHRQCLLAFCRFQVRKTC